MNAVFLSLLASLFLALPARAEVVLTLGHAVSADHPRAQASQYFADTLKRRSGGRITVDVLGGASFGDDVAMLKALQDGSLDISANSQGPLSAFVPEINAFGLPFLFDRPEQAQRLLDGPLGEQLAHRMAQAGFVSLGFWDNGIRHFSNSVRPLLKPADFAGLRFRTPADPVAVYIVRALGGQAVEIRFSALYQALQRRTVDGQENPLINFHAARLHEVQTHLSLTAHKYEITPFVMSRRAWNALSTADQDMLRTVASESTSHQRALTRKAEEDAYQALRASGIQISRISRPAFVAATRPIYKKWIAGPGGAYIRQVVEAADE